MDAIVPRCRPRVEMIFRQFFAISLLNREKSIYGKEGYHTHTPSRNILLLHKISQGEQAWKRQGL
jgi:hypothetical protein